MGHLKNVCGLKCYNCNKYEHKSNNCRENKINKHRKSVTFAQSAMYSDVKQNQENDSDFMAFCAIQSKCRADEKMVLYAGSGAAHHYTGCGI
ncbi:hypothetical protein ABEB36_014222 [Hypothenemus hampei]|uniref:CCHC-type domain-containing protein n=1 Tax=Hypothenemus hampei TaxID=57062 RepID=A0ABD1E3X6_HYPHA